MTEIAESVQESLPGYSDYDCKLHELHYHFAFIENLQQ